PIRQETEFPGPSESKKRLPHRSLIKNLHFLANFSCDIPISTCYSCILLLRHAEMIIILALACIVAFGLFLRWQPEILLKFSPWFGAATGCIIFVGLLRIVSPVAQAEFFIALCLSPLIGIFTWLFLRAKARKWIAHIADPRTLSA
ncbi:hypothetical protein ACX4MT_06515, partial [Roseomonas mucosa]